MGIIMNLKVFFNGFTSGYFIQLLRMDIAMNWVYLDVTVDVDSILQINNLYNKLENNII